MENFTERKPLAVTTGGGQATYFEPVKNFRALPGDLGHAGNDPYREKIKS